MRRSKSFLSRFASLKISLVAALSLALLLPLAALAQDDGPTALEDDTIQTIVESRLAKRGLASKVSVTVEDRVVTLSGTVDSLAEKNQAERLASSVDDVDRVVDGIELAVAERANQEIAEDISRAIDNYVLYSIFDWVEGQVVDGRVMLEGYVTDPWKKTDLEQHIEDIQGVRSVENGIQVLAPVDDDLRISLARRIYNDLIFLGRAAGATQPIHIVVRDGGDVQLEGVVRSQVEKRVAGNLARTHPWTFDVQNNLRVAGSPGSS